MLSFDGNSHFDPWLPPDKADAEVEAITSSVDHPVPALSPEFTFDADEDTPFDDPLSVAAASSGSARPSKRKQQRKQPFPPKVAKVAVESVATKCSPREATLDDALSGVFSRFRVIDPPQSLSAALEVNSPTLARSMGV